MSQLVDSTFSTQQDPNLFKIHEQFLIVPKMGINMPWPNHKLHYLSTTSPNHTRLTLCFAQIMLPSATVFLLWLFLLLALPFLPG
jgi:hypothetical protein